MSRLSLAAGRKCAHARSFERPWQPFTRHKIDVADKKRRSLQAYLRELFQSFRKVIQTHPNVAPLIVTQLVSNTNMSLEFVEQLLAALSKAGLSGTNLVGAYNTIVAGLVGFAAQEFAPVPTEESVEWQAEVRDRLATISRDDFPVLASNLPLLSNRAFILRWQNGIDSPLDESFRIYVDIIIAGIEKLIADTSSASAG